MNYMPPRLRMGWLIIAFVGCGGHPDSPPPPTCPPGTTSMPVKTGMACVTQPFADFITCLGLSLTSSELRSATQKTVDRVGVKMADVELGRTIASETAATILATSRPSPDGCRQINACLTKAQAPTQLCPPGEEFLRNHPLEPLALVYDVEFKMDQPMLQVYSSRVQKDIFTYLVGVREGRGKTTPDLADEHMVFVLSNKTEWRPAETEGAANYLFRDDATTFTFKGKGEIRFMCSKVSDILVKRPAVGPLEVKVEALEADYARRIFTKRVVCRNPARMGDDATTSAYYLIGRKVTAEPAFSPYPDQVVTSFAIRFSNDYQNRSHDRTVKMKDGSAVLEPRDIGMSTNE